MRLDDELRDEARSRVGYGPPEPATLRDGLRAFRGIALGCSIAIVVAWIPVVVAVCLVLFR